MARNADCLPAGSAMTLCKSPKLVDDGSVLAWCLAGARVKHGASRLTHLYLTTPQVAHTQFSAASES